MEVWEEQLEGASYFCSTWGIGCQPRCSGAGRRSGKCCRGNCWWKRAIFRYSILPLDKLFVLSYIDIWLSIDVQNAVTKENQVMADYGGTSKKNTWISAKSMQWRRKWGRLCRPTPAFLPTANWTQCLPKHNMRWRFWLSAKWTYYEKLTTSKK